MIHIREDDHILLVSSLFFLCFFDMDHFIDLQNLLIKIFIRTIILTNAP